MKLVLHSYWRSSASHRVRIGLGLKQLPYDYVAIDITKGRPSVGCAGEAIVMAHRRPPRASM